MEPKTLKQALIDLLSREYLISWGLVVLGAAMIWRGDKIEGLTLVGTAASGYLIGRNVTKVAEIKAGAGQQARDDSKPAG